MNTGAIAVLLLGVTSLILANQRKKANELKDQENKEQEVKNEE